MYSDAMVIEVGPHKVINDGRQDDAFLAVLKKCATCRHANEGDTRRKSTGAAGKMCVLTRLEGLGIGFAMHKGYQCQIDRLLRYYFANFRHTQKYE